MPITINTNVSAMVSQRNLGASSMRSASSLSKLSSGSRVPTAKEDAASLAVGTGLRVDVTALKAAQVNAQQATSMLQIADGAFGQIGDILNRMKSLATTAQSGQLSNTERGFLDQEYGLLHDEINRIAESTVFNGERLLGEASYMEVTTVGAEFVAGSEAEGIVGFKFDANVVTNGDQFAIHYNAATANFSLANVTTGEIQTVNLGEPGSGVAAVSAGQTREISFGNLGVTLTLDDSFNAGAFLGAGADIGTPADLAGTADYSFNALEVVAAADKVLDFQVGIGAVAGVDTISATINGGTFEALTGGAYTDITTTVNAGTASGEIDSAVDAVNVARANLGSYMNRLEFAQSNLAVTIENTEAARSILMDVDVSVEITKFTSEQVLIQAGVSMLAQANQQPSLLLRLLQ